MDHRLKRNWTLYKKKGKVTNKQTIMKKKSMNVYYFYFKKVL